MDKTRVRRFMQSILLPITAFALILALEFWGATRGDPLENPLRLVLSGVFAVGLVAWVLLYVRARAAENNTAPSKRARVGGVLGGVFVFTALMFSTNIRQLLLFAAFALASVVLGMAAMQWQARLRAVPSRKREAPRGR